MSTQKFRPVLSPKEIEHIVLLCKNEQPAPSTASMKLLTKLAPMLTKIEIGAVKPAYTITEHADLMSVLGAAPAIDHASNDLNDDPTILRPEDYPTKEQYWKACHGKFLMCSAACTVAELQAANEWRYLNELMTEEEAREFELRGL